MQLSGDNGIITQARNATYMQKCAAIEEFLQGYYVEKYEEFEGVNSKIGTLQSIDESKDWFYKGKFGYVVDTLGKVHYFLVPEKMPEEVQNIIGEYEEKGYADYVECKDVYGVTEELKVYYCSDGIDSIIGASLEDLNEENGEEIIFSGDSDFGKLVNGGNGEDITRKDVRGITSLTIDETTGITDLNELYNFTALTDLTLNNLNINTLSGLEYATNITAIFINNCKIGNYSAIAELNKIEYLFIKNADNKEVENLCSETVGIGQKDITSLRYLGIYGIEHYRYGETYTNIYSDNIHSSLTDISYLSNLSTATKESITNLLLNNNSITNIDNLYEFKNLSNLRVENNYLTDLKGIYNKEKNIGMTELQYLFARGNCLGKEIEVDEINPEADALSSFAVTNLNGENYEYSKILNRIGLLDLNDNPDLKWIDYLKGCTSLQKLYINNCGSIKQLSLINTSNIISGVSTLELNQDQKLIVALANNNAKDISLANKEMTREEFTSLLSNKEKLEKLDLENFDLKNDDGSNINDEEKNKIINETLSKLTALKYLKLKGLGYLNSVDFVEYTPNLMQLDLRGTKTADLSKINKYSVNMGSIVIDYTETDITKIQDLINRMYDGKSTSRREGAFYTISGAILCNTTLINKIENCTNITSYKIYDEESFVPDNATWNFKNCTNLQRFFIIYVNGNYYLPINITKIDRIQAAVKILNETELINLEYIKFDWTDFESAKNIVNNLPNLKRLDFYGDPNLFKLEEITNKSRYEYLAIYGYNRNKESSSLTIENLKTLEEFTNLKTLNLQYNKKLTELPQVENLNNLETIILNDTGITSAYPFKNLKNLKELNLKNTPLYETGFYESLNGETGNCNNMDIFAELNSQSLRKLYLSRTYIEDFSKINKLSWEDKDF